MKFLKCLCFCCYKSKSKDKIPMERSNSIIRAGEQQSIALENQHSYVEEIILENQAGLEFHDLTIEERKGTSENQSVDIIENNDFHEPHAENDSPEDQILGKKIFIDTKVKIENIKRCDSTSVIALRSKFPYNCPICFSFFSNILLTKCCKQYICHFCVKDIIEKHVKFQIACPHCRSEPLCLSDVDPCLSLRKYSDSPYNSIKPGTKPPDLNYIPMPVVEEIGGHIEESPSGLNSPRNEFAIEPDAEAEAKIDHSED